MMRRGWKIFWITCAVMMVTGIVCCITAMILGVTKEALTDVYIENVGDKIGIYKDDNSEEGMISEDSSTSYTGIQKIDAELYAGEVYVKTTSDDKITVETSELNEALGFSCRQDGNTLKLTTRKHDLHLNKSGTITVFIPQDMILEEAELSLGAGSLYIGDIRARDLEIEIGAGEAEIDYFEANVVKASCGAGKLSFTGIPESSVNIECGAGKVEFYASGDQNDYNYEIESGIGEINVGDRTYSGLAQECYIDNRSGKNITVDCGMGQVNIYHMEMTPASTGGES